MSSQIIKENENLDLASLASLVEEKKAELSKMKFDHAMLGLENPLSIRELRRDIARLITLKRSKEISSLSDEALAQRTKIRKRRK